MSLLIFSLYVDRNLKIAKPVEDLMGEMHGLYEFPVYCSLSVKKRTWLFTCGAVWEIAVERRVGWDGRPVL